MKAQISMMQIVIGVIIAVVVFSIAVQQGLIELPAIPGGVIGFTTLSLDKAQFTSSSNFFNDETYILTVSQGGLGQFATASISPEDIVREGSSEKPTDEFDIRITYSEQACEYTIRPDTSAIPIFSYVLKEYPIDFFDPLCQDINRASSAVRGFNLLSFGKPGGFSFTCVAVQRNPEILTIAKQSIDNPSVHTIADIETLGGKNNALNGNIRVDTSGNIQGFVGSNAYVTWDGYLVRDVCAINQDQFTGLFENGQWKIGSDANYDAYISTKATEERVLTNPSGGNLIDLQFSIDNLNEASRIASLTKSFGDFITNSRDINNAVIIQQLDSLVNVPVYTFFIKADAIGITQPVADITPVSCNWDPFNTNGNIQVNLRNFGEAGNAEVSASCPQLNTGTSKTISLGTGQSGDIFLPVSGQTDTSRTVTCNVNVNNAAGDTNSLQCSTTQNPEITCSPAGKIFCSGNQIKQCNSEQQTTIIQTCSGSCSIDNNGNPICSEVNLCPNSGAINSPICNQCAEGFELVGAIPFISDTGKCEQIQPELPLSLIFGAVAGIFGFLLVGGREAFEGNRFKQVLGITVAVVFAAIAWFVVENSVAFAIGLGIAAVLGGLAIFFFGGAILAFLTVLAVIIGKVKG